MVTYALSAGADHIFDPAVGAGAFLVAAKSVATRQNRRINLLGTELDSAVLNQALAAGLSQADIAGIEIRDFVLNSPLRHYSAIVANPPYIRHHRLDEETKQSLKQLSKSLLGKALDGRAGYHVYFLIRALERLEPGGHLSFILPADTCEGIFANALWKWVMDSYRLDAVVTFADSATPFPGVDTNAVVFMISASPPDNLFTWCRCLEPMGVGFREWVERGCPPEPTAQLHCVRREISEAFRTGLSRAPQEEHHGPLLGDFCKTLRGIASGANEFFFLTSQQIMELGLPLEYFIRAVGRTRDIDGKELALDRLEELDREGRPTYLLSLDDKPTEQLPASLQSYLERGRELNLHARSLIAQRKPWYKMEKRSVPPFFFAYLGRRDARFIRNNAEAVPLTGFLCVYPRNGQEEDQIWRLLNHEDTITNLARVAKSYGSGAIKVEPRALERVPLSERALQYSGLSARYLDRFAPFLF
jgi:tRNA1(Val) A37 N6-methylase TrmN6